MKKERTTKTISLTIDRSVNEKISELAINKSKLTEWLFIKYLEEIGIDTKNIRF